MPGSPRSDVAELLSQIWPAPYEFEFSTRPRPHAAGLTFALLPRPQHPTLLVPTRPHAVAASVLRSYWSPATRRGAAATAIVARAAALGAVRLAPWTVTIHGAPGAQSFLDYLSSHLGQEIHAGISLGPPRANRKPVLRLLTASGAPVAFAKVGVNDLTCSRVVAETRALQVLRDVPLRHLVVPEVLQVPTWAELTCLVTRPVPTKSRGRGDPALRGVALRGLVAALGQEVHPLAESPWWQGLSSRIDSLADTPDAAAIRCHRDQIGVVACGAELLHGAAHGDWSPWNVATDGDTAVAWDWERFATNVPVGLDALHFATQDQIGVRGASPPEGLHAVLRRCQHVVVENGALPSHARILFALYLLELGERFLADEQETAGSRRGPLSNWLLPTLKEAVAGLGQVVR